MQFKKILKEHGYSEKAITEILKWYQWGERIATKTSILPWWRGRGVWWRWSASTKHWSVNSHRCRYRPNSSRILDLLQVFPSATTGRGIRNLIFIFPLYFLLFVFFIFHCFVRVLMLKYASTVRVRMLNQHFPRNFRFFPKHLSVRLSTFKPSLSIRARALEERIHEKGEIREREC